MKDPLTRLTEKTTALGNYNHKYLYIISSNVDKLTAALEKHGKSDGVHLWSYSTEIPGEMDTILQVAADDNERLDLLGCYFGLQFLNMNLRMVDIAKLELTTGPLRWQTGRRLMLEAGRSFRFITKCYLERLMSIFLGTPIPPEFVMLGVGTRADQDDIDLGFVHRYTKHAEVLNRAIGRLASEMFRKATRLHFHLSEHVGESGFTATLEQYEEILDDNRYDFVMVTEMLGAAVILGSFPLFEEFKNRVTNRFYFNPGKPENRFHEGYLRGILGEIHSLLNRPRPVAVLSPKDDCLRPIKSLLTALKLVYGVNKVNAWDIIDNLKEKNPERLSQYEDLEESLSFFELYRHLYQIMVAQDEDINLDEPGIVSMLADIAEIMGFERKGMLSAKDFMLVNYHEFHDNSVEAIEVLTDDLKKHLRKVSILRPIFSGGIHTMPGYRGNLAVDFIRSSSFSKGITYWDDFLEELDSEDRHFYDEFIDSFLQLPQRLQQRVARVYVAGLLYDPGSVLRFLVVLGENAEREQASVVFNTISRMFIESLRQSGGVSAALSQLVYAHPEFLNSFLARIEWDHLARLAELAHRTPALPELTTIHKQLLGLIDVHYQSSQFFQRHFHPILNKYPVYIRNLHHNDRLRKVSDGIYSDLTSLPTLDERLERLGDYYDLEFVRVSLLAMAGVGSERTDAEFIEFCDNYTLSLYDFCHQDVHLSLGYSRHTHEHFALCATGGHGREQGFDDDYDLVVFLDSGDPQQIEFSNKIVAKMNAHISRRGIVPHHRFADHFGRYVVTFDELTRHFAGHRDDAFVDQSQLLNSRMLIGNRKLEAKLQQEIITPCIFDRASEYIECMKAEMNSRHAWAGDQSSNIKECHGGLRDIEMLLLMYKAKHRIHDPVSLTLLEHLTEIEEKRADLFKHVRMHLSFIKNLRDLYRLKVAAHNVIEPEYLPPIASTLGYGEDAEVGDRLHHDFLKKTKEVGVIIDELVGALII
jgi:hypothetical protein